MKTKIDIFIFIFIIFSTVFVFSRVINYDFVNYDDLSYVAENEFVNNGISFESIVWSFTNILVANWHPITSISHMIDCELFGLNAGWHHLTNLIFHILNSLLLYAFFRKVTGNIWQSGFVAILFAIHPLHVESVAWISERKDVLSTFWGLLALLAYIRYLKHTTLLRYLIVTFFFILGLMSKPMLVTLPFLLLLLDFWPLQRFNFQHLSNVMSDNRHSFRSSLIEKLPLCFLSLISCLITLLAQKHGGAIWQFDQIPFSHRLANAVVSYIVYIYKMIYPMDLCVLYPLQGKPQWLDTIISAILIILVTIFSIRKIHSHPFLIVGWLWFLGTLVPVIGLVQVGNQALADRYTYIPLIGLFVIFAWGGAAIISKLRHKQIIMFSTSFCLLFFYMFIARQQVSYWENGLTLSHRAVDVTSENFVMLNNLAYMYLLQGDYPKAIENYIEALRIQPYHKSIYQNFKTVLDMTIPEGSVAERMEAAISAYPEEAPLYFLCGKMYHDENNNVKAITYYKKAIETDKRSIRVYYELSMLYEQNSELDKALAIMKKLLTVEPKSPNAYARIGHINKIQGNEEKADH